MPKLFSCAFVLLLILATGPSLAQTQAAPAPIFVLNSKDADVSVIDPVSWKEIKRFATGKEPHHLYLSVAVTMDRQKKCCVISGRS